MAAKFMEKNGEKSRKTMEHEGQIDGQMIENDGPIDETMIIGMDFPGWMTKKFFFNIGVSSEDIEKNPQIQSFWILIFPTKKDEFWRLPMPTTWGLTRELSG